MDEKLPLYSMRACEELLMRPDRRTFLRLMLATAAAEAVDFEKLLWTPRPIVTVPALPLEILDQTVAIPGTYGAIQRSTYAFWRNLYEGRSAMIDKEALFDKMAEAIRIPSGWVKS
jgi:hypothetical protein